MSPHPKYIEGAAKVATEGDFEERKVSIQAVNAYGIEAIKAVFLLNGGAIIALLALLGALLGKEGALASGAARSLTQHLVPGFYCYIGGVVSAALIAGIGYLNWSLIADQRWHPVHWGNLLNGTRLPDSPKWYDTFIHWSRITAIFLFFVSLGCFVGGSWLVARSFLKAQI